MHKRVLLAEQSDTIRGIAGTVLRQNGFEVISVSTADKALEVLNFSRPDLLIIGGNMLDRSQRPLYERVQGDARFSSIPILLLADPEKGELPFPEEVIISVPFHPRDFLERVMVFAGRPAAPQQPAPVNPLDGAGLEDEAIDRALGLDRIEVTDSEIMDKTGTIRRPKKKPPEKMIGLDHEDKTNEDITDSSRVESIMIRDEQTDIVQKKEAGRPPLKPTSTGKLDILTDSDQYAMNDPGTPTVQSQEKTHDYDWFLSEMRQEAQSPAEPPPASTPPAPDGRLSVAEPSSFIDPITPPPGQNAEQRPDGSVEKFIDEFKKEVDKIQENEPESIMLEADKPSANGSDSQPLDWEDSLEKTTSEQMNLFTKEFSASLADRIAEKIVAKIDADKLLRLIRNEIIARAENRK